MAAHRFYRLTVATAYTWESYTYIASIELRAAAGGANLALTGNGTPSASSFSGGNAFDGNPATAQTLLTNPNEWVQWDFGAGNQQDINHLTIVNRGGGDNVGAATGNLSCSDDGTAWTLMMGFTNPGGSGASTATIYSPPTLYTMYLTAPLIVVTGYTGAQARVFAPGAIASVGGGASAALVLPSATLDAYGGARATLALPVPAFYAVGHDSTGEQAASLTAPSALLSARGGANARLTSPSLALGIRATFTNWGESDISAPSATLSASGTVSGMGQAALTFNDPYKLVGYSGAVASITLTGGYTVQAQSTAGSIGGAAITCPLFELTATATRQNSGSANLLAPAARLGAQAQAWLAAPGFQLTAIGSATITATYEAYAVNLLHRNTDAPVNEATRYTNFPFTHVVRYKNSYYGANSTGLYLLEGTTDDGAAIPWEFKTTITDFESPMGKTAVSAYFAGRMGPAATVSIHLGESGDVSYSHSTPRGPAAQNYRQVFGLGLKSRYYALSVAGEGVMEMDAVEFNNKPLTRRI